MCVCVCVCVGGGRLVCRWVGVCVDGWVGVGEMYGSTHS